MKKSCLNKPPEDEHYGDGDGKNDDNGNEDGLPRDELKLAVVDSHGDGRVAGANHLTSVAIREEHLVDDVTLDERKLTVVRTGDGQVELTVVLSSTALWIGKLLRVKDEH